jgi:hypothetical protein
VNNTVSRPASRPTEPFALAPTYAFSQSSLQAFEDCRRRFWLTYVEQLPWPAVEAAPVEEHERLLRLGATFHRLVERAEIGMGQAEAVDPDAFESPLREWLAAYRLHRPPDLPSAFIEAEHVLSIPFPDAPGEGSARYRLAAKFDLIAADPADESGHAGRVVIVDWKTSRTRTDPGILRRRLQSLVYPYVLVEASRSLPWGPVRPEQVEMRYWFAAAPEHPVVFAYDAAQHAANGERLRTIVAAILAGRGPDDFPRVPDTPAFRRRFCDYCIYRSRCNRGQAAGALAAIDDLEELYLPDVASDRSAFDFTLADVAELTF